MGSQHCYKTNEMTIRRETCFVVRGLDLVTGVLEAHLLYPSESGGVTFLRDYWFMYLGGTSDYPWILKRLEVGNPTAGAITFRMALTTVDDGTPGISNAFLAWDTPVAAGEVWRWEGHVPSAGRYYYGKAREAGLTVYVGAEEGV